MHVVHIAKAYPKQGSRVVTNRKHSIEVWFIYNVTQCTHASYLRYNIAIHNII